MTFVTRGKRSHIWMIVLITVSIHPMLLVKVNLETLVGNTIIKLETKIKLEESFPFRKNRLENDNLSSTTVQDSVKSRLQRPVFLPEVDSSVDFGGRG